MSIEEENKKITDKAQETRKPTEAEAGMSLIIEDLLKVIHLMTQAATAQTYATLLAIEGGGIEEMQQKIDTASALNEEAGKIMKELLPKVLKSKTP